MSHIISFLGGDSQVGTTMVAQSVAEVLSRRGRKVLFIAGSGKLGDDFISCTPEQSIDRLAASILSGSLKEKELMGMFEDKKGLSIIAGTLRPKQIRELPDNTFWVILHQIENHFDYVIIDGGDGTCERLTMSALQIATTTYMVITQQPKTIRRFQYFQQRFGRSSDRKLILNKFLQEPSLLMKGEVERVCDAKVDVIIPYVEYGWQAEVEKSTLIRDKRFGKGVQFLVDAMDPKEEQEEAWKVKCKDLWPFAKP